MSDKAISEDLMARLQRHYIKPGEAFPGGMFLPEVGWNDGGQRLSRCDAIYVGFTNSSARLLVGHEIKASRSDWMRELANPSKADAWADECHQWWLVTAPGVVHDGELPHGWGHMVPGPSRTRLKICAPAAVTPDRAPSWAAARSLLARADTLRAQSIVDARIKATEDANAEIDRRVAARRELDNASTDEGRAQVMLDQLHDALGMQVVERFAYDDDHVTPHELRRGLARYLAADRDLQRAARDFARRYRGPVDMVREQLDQMTSALVELEALARQDVPA